MSTQYIQRLSGVQPLAFHHILLHMGSSLPQIWSGFDFINKQQSQELQHRMIWAILNQPTLILPSPLVSWWIFLWLHFVMDIWDGELMFYTFFLKVIFKFTWGELASIVSMENFYTLSRGHLHFNFLLTESFENITFLFDCICPNIPSFVIYKCDKVLSSAQ